MSATDPSDRERETEGTAVWLPSAHFGDGDQGIYPIAARPGVVCDDRDDPGDAAVAVRLRHQYHAAPSPDRGAATGGQRSRPFDPKGAAKHRLFPTSPSKSTMSTSSTICCCRARCYSVSKFPAALNAQCGAAIIRHFWSQPTRPIRWRLARRYQRSASLCRPRWRTICS